LNSRDFVYWLQGYFEISGSTNALTFAQQTIIRNHLNMVFKHEIDPSFGDKEALEALCKIHSGSQVESTYR